MNVVKITQLFSDGLKEEIDFWLDHESPFYEDDTWIKESDSLYTLSNAYVNTLHKVLTDISREIFQVHNLLPSVATLKWIEGNNDEKNHIDSGPSEYTIIYNYFSEDKIFLTHENEKLEIGQQESVAYEGYSNFHTLNNFEGTALLFYFSFAKPDNAYFHFGQYNDDGTISFPSGK
tara:strand:+ start:732 stop:1259 length:528 start_codon:yes stop_codon:yes gene_type:complete